MKVVLGADGSEHAQFATEFLARYPLGEGALVDCCGVYSHFSATNDTAL